MRKILIIAVVFVAGCASLPNDQELALWKQQSAALTRDIAEVEIQLSAVSDPIERAGLQAKLQQMKSFAARLDTGIQDAQTAGEARSAALDALLWGVAGAIPGFGLAVPLIKRGFSVANHLMKSVDAGGGVKDGAAASAELMKSPAAAKAFQKHKAANGG